MSNKKSWIPWNDRIDLKELCLTISYEFYGESSCDVISLKRKIPKHCLSKIEIDIYSYLRSQYVYYFNLTIEEVKLLAIDCNKKQLATISKDRLEYRGFFASNINDIYSIIDEIEQIDKGEFLRNNNEWIPWNNRENLEKVYLLMETELESQVSVEYLENVGALGVSEDAPCYCKTSVIFPLGKIPDNLLVDGIGDIAWEEFGLSCCSNVRLYILTESQLSKTQKRAAKNYKSYCEKNEFKSDFVYLTILKIVRDYENSDREHFLRKEKNTLSEESTPVSDVNDSPAVPTAPVASVPEDPVDMTSIRPCPQIFAKSDEATSAGDENGATGMVVAANTARIANNTDLLSDIAGTLKRMAEFQRENARTASEPITDAPAAADDMPDVLSVPEYDNPNEWISLVNLAQVMVAKGLSIDINAAKDNLRNMKSKGQKSEEKYNGKNSAFGESIHGKWRMVQLRVKWFVYFYRPSITWITTSEK